MLALCRTHRSSLFRCHPRHGRGVVHRRPFMQGLCDAFLDLAIALPFPAALPPYSTTIILTTVVARVALLPVAIWVGQCSSPPEKYLEHFPGQEAGMENRRTCHSRGRKAQASRFQTGIGANEKGRHPGRKTISPRNTCETMY